MVKTSMDHDYLPILRYVRQCLLAKKWDVYALDTHPPTQVTFKARKKVFLHRVDLTMQISQPNRGREFYLTKFQISGKGINLCNAEFVLSQYKKELHSVSDEPLGNLWSAENGLSVSKLLENYDKIAADLGYPKLFQGKHNN